MNKKFKIERTIYAMGLFIALLGVLFLIARSDAVLKFRYFNQAPEQVVLQQKVNGSQYTPSYLLLTGPDQPALHYALKDRLELMGKKVMDRPIDSVESEVDLENFSAVVIATEQIDLLKETDVLLRFVKNGGSLFFATCPSPGPALSTLYQAMGLVETGFFVGTSGIELDHPFFSENGKTSFPSPSIINSSLSVRLAGDADLFASSSSGIPLLWKASYGEGAFIVFNGTMFVTMEEQALFVKGIQLASKHVIMPVVNAQVTELDGFPFLVPDGRDLSASYTNPDYYRTVVWPELQRIESKYDLNYTASYTPPGDAVFSEGDPSRALEDLRLYGRELLRMGGEIATQEPVFKTPDKLARFRKVSLQHIQEALPDYPVRSAVSSLPKVNMEATADVPVMLTPNAYIKKLEDTIVLPKTIEGFDPGIEGAWKLFNEVAVSGYYAHSLYPYRFVKEGNAEKQLAAFSGFQQSTEKQIPWIRPLPLSKAGEAAYAYVNSNLYEKHDGNKLTFYATRMVKSTPAYYYFSTSRTITKTENCEVEKIGKDLYLIETDQLTFSIVLEGLQ